MRCSIAVAPLLWALALCSGATKRPLGKMVLHSSKPENNMELLDMLLRIEYSTPDRTRQDSTAHLLSGYSLARFSLGFYDRGELVIRFLDGPGFGRQFPLKRFASAVRLAFVEKYKGADGLPIDELLELVSIVSFLIVGPSPDSIHRLGTFYENISTALCACGDFSQFNAIKRLGISSLIFYFTLTRLTSGKSQYRRAVEYFSETHQLMDLIVPIHRDIPGYDTALAFALFTCNTDCVRIDNEKFFWNLKEIRGKMLAACRMKMLRCPFWAVKADAPEIFNNIRILELEGTVSTLEGLLAKFPHLRHIVLLDPAKPEMLRSSPPEARKLITEMKLDASDELTQEEYLVIGEMAELSSLEVVGPGFSLVSMLEAAPTASERLTSLSICGSHLAAPDGLPGPLSLMRSLDELVIGGNGPVEVIEGAPISNRLRAMELRNMQIGEETARSLSRFISLNTLKLLDCTEEPQGEAPVDWERFFEEHSSTLKTLIVKGGRIDCARLLEGAMKCSDLEKLEIAGHSIPAELLATLPVPNMELISSLKFLALSLSSVPLSPSAIGALASLDSLKELRVSLPDGREIHGLFSLSADPGTLVPGLTHPSIFSLTLPVTPPTAAVATEFLHSLANLRELALVVSRVPDPSEWADSLSRLIAGVQRLSDVRILRIHFEEGAHSEELLSALTDPNTPLMRGLCDITVTGAPAESQMVSELTERFGQAVLGSGN